MRYAFHDLGQQPEGATVTVRLSGSSANVVLLDPQNFAQYRPDSRLQTAPRSTSD